MDIGVFRSVCLERILVEARAVHAVSLEVGDLDVASSGPAVRDAAVGPGLGVPGDPVLVSVQKSLVRTHWSQILQQALSG